MLDSHARDWIPAIKNLNKMTIHPIVITICAMVAGLITAGFIFGGQPWLAVLFLILSGGLDVLDGSLARATGKVSEKGAVLDIVSDRVVEASIIIALALVDPISRALSSLIMLSSVLICITSFLVVGIFVNNDSKKSFYYSAGLMERTEAFLFFGGMILFPQSFLLLSSLFSGLVFLTAAIRVGQFLKNN